MTGRAASGPSIAAISLVIAVDRSRIDLSASIAPSADETASADALSRSIARATPAAAQTSPLSNWSAAIGVTTGPQNP